MLMLTVDFNAIANGLVRGLQEDAIGDGELTAGSLVQLDDGEGNEALGTVREIKDGLLYAEVDWDTWGPAGQITWTNLLTPGKGRFTDVSITGNIWRPLDRPQSFKPRVRVAVRGRVCV